MVRAPARVGVLENLKSFLFPVDLFGQSLHPTSPDNSLEPSENPSSSPLSFGVSDVLLGDLERLPNVPASTDQQVKKSHEINANNLRINHWINHSNYSNYKTNEQMIETLRGADASSPNGRQRIGKEFWMIRKIAPVRALEN